MKKSNSGNGDHYCLLHGPNTHPTNECKALKEHANSIKNGDKKVKGKSGNKSWNHRASEATQNSKKDLAAFIQKEINKGVQKELNSAEKKRKASFDLKAFDEELKDFNYKDMEELDIDLDDDGSASA